MDYRDRLQPSRRHVVRSRIGRPDPRLRTDAAPSAFGTAKPPLAPEVGPGEEPPSTATVPPARVRGALRRRAEEGKVGLAILLWLLGVPGLLVLLYLVIA